MVGQVDKNGSPIWLHEGNVKATDKARLSYLQDGNIFRHKVIKCLHSNEEYKIVYHLTRNLAECYIMTIHNEVEKNINLVLCNYFNISRHNKL